MKKKKVIPEVNETPINSTPLPEGVVIKFDTQIELLGLNLDLGRQDLNENFKKVEEKINEIIKKVN